MAKIYSGITQVAYSTNGTDFTAITGSIASDSTLTPSTITVDTTDSTVFGGEQLEMSIGVLDFANYTTLRDAMIADTRYFWRFTFAGGATETTASSFPFQVVKIINPDKRTGLNRYNINGFIALSTETLTSA
jgi:hypothetical protein